MLRAEVHAIFYNGDGLPLRRAMQLANSSPDPRENIEYLKLVQEIGFYTRRYRANSDVTPWQHATKRNMFDTLEFGFGRANIVTHWSTADKSAHIPIQDIEIDETTPGMLFDINKEFDNDGNSERFVLAEFTYHEVEDDDDQDAEETPTPSPSPSFELIPAA